MKTVQALKDEQKRRVVADQLNDARALLRHAEERAVALGYLKLSKRIARAHVNVERLAVDWWHETKR